MHHISWVQWYESWLFRRKIKSIAKLLNQYEIFSDSVAMETLSRTNKFEPDIYEYTDLQVFHVLESQLEKRILLIINEIKKELKSL